METRRLGTTDLHVGVLALGTMMFGGRTDETEAQRILGRALDAGITLVDTADVYTDGESERIVGRALRSGNRATTSVLDQGRLPTVGRWRAPSAVGIASLRGLAAPPRTVHRPLPDPPPHPAPHRETLQALAELVADERCQIGTSMFPGWRLVEAAWAAETLGIGRFASNSPPTTCSSHDRTRGRSRNPCTRHVRVLMGPLAGGLLTDDPCGPTAPDARWSGGRDRTDVRSTSHSPRARVSARSRRSPPLGRTARLAWLIAQPASPGGDRGHAQPTSSRTIWQPHQPRAVSSTRSTGSSLPDRAC